MTSLTLYTQIEALPAKLKKEAKKLLADMLENQSKEKSKKSSIKKMWYEPINTSVGAIGLGMSFTVVPSEISVFSAKFWTKSRYDLYTEIRKIWKLFERTKT